MIHSDRTQTILKLCQEYIDNETIAKDIHGTDIFGQRRFDNTAAVRGRIEGQLVKMLGTSDAEWDKFISATSAEVEQADHPRHSVGV